MLLRREGLAVLAILVGGYFAGSILGGLLANVAASLAHGHPSYAQLATMAKPPWWFPASSLLGLWCGMGAAVYFSWRLTHLFQLRPLLKFRPTDLWFLLLGAAVQLLAYLAYLPFHVKNLSGPEQRIFGGSVGLAFTLLCVMSVFGAPLFEEFFFRAALVKALSSLPEHSRTVGSVTVVVLVDGILFGAAHGEWLLLPALVLLGALLAYLFVRTNRLMPSLFTHLSFNAAAVVALLVQRAHL